MQPPADSLESQDPGLASHDGGRVWSGSATRGGLDLIHQATSLSNYQTRRFSLMEEEEVLSMDELRSLISSLDRRVMIKAMVAPLIGRWNRWALLITIHCARPIIGCAACILQYSAAEAVR